MSRRSDIWTPGYREPWMLDVEPSPTKGYTTPDGRHFQDCILTVSEEKADMMWKGYMCARCTEPFREAYPDRCGVCGFPVKELQRKLLERDFLGRDPTAVAGFPIDRELEHLEREHHKPKGLMTMPKEI